MRSLYTSVFVLDFMLHIIHYTKYHIPYTPYIIKKDECFLSPNRAASVDLKGWLFVIVLGWLSVVVRGRLRVAIRGRIRVAIRGRIRGGHSWSFWGVHSW